MPYRHHEMRARPIGRLGGDLSTLTRAVHTRAVNHRRDRDSTTALFADPSTLDLYALAATSILADQWMRDRPHWLIGTLDPRSSTYSLDTISEMLSAGALA